MTFRKFYTTYEGLKNGPFYLRFRKDSGVYRNALSIKSFRIERYEVITLPLIEN